MAFSVGDSASEPSGINLGIFAAAVHRLRESSSAEESVGELPDKPKGSHCICLSARMANAAAKRIIGLKCVCGRGSPVVERGRVPHRPKIAYAGDVAAAAGDVAAGFVAGRRRA